MLYNKGLFISIPVVNTTWLAVGRAIFQRGLTGLLLWGLIGCSDEAGSSATNEEVPTDVVGLSSNQQANSNVQLGVLSEQNLGQEIFVQGVIDVPSKNRFSMHSPFEGFVRTAELLPGHFVEKGMVLLTVENPSLLSLQEQLMTTSAQRDFLQGEYIRQEALLDKKIASSKQFEEAKSQYLSNEAQYQASKKQLQLLGLPVQSIEKGNFVSEIEIRAPEDAYVVDVHVNQGQYVLPSMEMMTLISHADLHVELKVFEEDVALLKPGQSIVFSILNDDTVQYDAEVFLVGGQVDVDRSIRVHGHLKQPVTTLLPGMFVDAKILVEPKMVWSLPESAIVRFEGKHYVFVQTDNQNFEMIEVQMGVEMGQWVEILEPSASLLKNRSVVTNEAFTLLSMMKNTEEEE